MSEKTPESKNSSIKIEEVHRKRDSETLERIKDTLSSNMRGRV